MVPKALGLKVNLLHVGSHEIGVEHDEARVLECGCLIAFRGQGMGGREKAGRRVASYRRDRWWGRGKGII